MIKTMENKNNKNDLAKQRTNLAVQRTNLSNTRTFSSWLRTGLSSVSVGLAIVKFIGDSEIFYGYVVPIGILFVLIGISMYIFALISYKNSFNELKQEDTELKSSIVFLTFVTIGMVLTAVLIMSLLIFSK